MPHPRLAVMGERPISLILCIIFDDVSSRTDIRTMQNPISADLQLISMEAVIEHPT